MNTKDIWLIFFISLCSLLKDNNQILTRNKALGVHVNWISSF